MESDNIAIFVRVRKQREDAGAKSVSTDPVKGTVVLHTPTEDRTFSFDRVGGEATTQEEVFEAVGQPLSDACMAGYNAAIFAYGQTGSGKTFTMGFEAEQASAAPEARGLTPRVLDYLFAWMARDERKTGGQLSYRCTGSLLEIHNETLTDLLDPPDASAAASCALPSVGGHGGLPTGHGGLRLREDATRGIYVEGLHHEDVGTADEATRLLQRGAAHRAVGSTAMNSHSSRSHLVFTLAVQATHEADDGIRRVRTALLHLVDLAGSERQRDTQATGARLREACHINRSLSALGNVITALTSGGGQSRPIKANQGALSALPSAVPSAAGVSGATHVPYRNSKLTLLLKDSLGGNSKTCIIATISPLERCFAETLSTLKFAQRAKLIRNQVTVPTDGPCFECSHRVFTSSSHEFTSSSP